MEPRGIKILVDLLDGLVNISFYSIVKHGIATIQPVHREDLAEGYWLILENFGKLRHTEYIISGYESMSLYEVFQKISSAIGKKVVFINVS